MKKLIIAALILLSTTAQMFAGPVVTIKVKIGKNKLDCAGFGICWKESGISLDFAMVANGTEDGTTMQINELTGNLDIIIPPNVWKEKSEFFLGTSVTFEEQVNIGQKVSTALKSPTIIVIQPGKYSVKKDRSNNAIISIRLGLENPVEISTK